MLVVDDDSTNLLVMREILEDDYELVLAPDGNSCLGQLREFRPALVLLDVMMPGINGYETCRRIKDEQAELAPQVILVSAKALTQERLEGYSAGADDYLTKPFDHDELLAKVRVHIKLHTALEDLSKANEVIQAYNLHLEEQIRTATEKVVATRDLTVFSLAKLTESRDHETGAHLERMREYSQILATSLSVRGPYQEEIDGDFLESLYLSSPLHDIGKVGIPDSILLKADKLTDAEFEVMKRHTLIGAEALEKVIERTCHGGFLAMAASIARYHHERFDGGGYPEGLRGVAIPLPARIVALADVFDALTSERPYKPAYDNDVAIKIIESERGNHFDPAVVDAFESSFRAFVRVQNGGSGQTTENTREVVNS